MKNMKKIIYFALTSLISLSLFSCGQPSSSSENNSSTDNLSSDIVRDDDELYVEAIEIIQEPDKLKYVANEEKFDPTGMVLKAVWNDGYVEDSVDLTKIYFEPQGVLPEDATSVTIYYGDASTVLSLDTNFTYELCVIQNPVKTDYVENDEFDPSGLILGRNIDGVKKEFSHFDLSKVVFEKKSLTKSDTSVTVSYDNHTVDIPIKVLSLSLKIELEDYSSVTMTNCKPKNLVTMASDGTYRYSTSTIKYDTYEEAYAKHTDSAKCQMENASGRDFLASINSSKSSFTVKFTPDFDTAYLRIRGASNAVGKYDTSSKPTTSKDMDLTKIMTVKVNGTKITIKSDAILKGITSSVPSDYVWTNWYTVLLSEVTLNPGEVNTIEFTFTENSNYIHPWGSALGQYDYILLERN